MIIKVFKPWLVIPLAAIIAIIGVTVAVDDSKHTVKHLVYTDDYPSQYADELNQIFGAYSLGERVEKHIEGEDCSCGYHQDTLDYYTWDVTYTDACGQTMHSTLNNYESLTLQMYRWLEDQIETHFYSNYVLPGFSKVMMETGSYCYGTIGRICTGYRGGDDEEYTHVQTCTAYRDELDKNGQLVALANLSYRDIFDLFPIGLSIQVRLNDASVDSSLLQSNYLFAVEQIHTEAEVMIEEIGENLNLRFDVYCDVPVMSGDERYSNTTYFFLRGQQVEINAWDFDHAVFRSYEGKFW